MEKNRQQLPMQVLLAFILFLGLLAEALAFSLRCGGLNVTSENSTVLAVHPPQNLSIELHGGTAESVGRQVKMVVVCKDSESEITLERMSLEGFNSSTSNTECDGSVSSWYSSDSTFCLVHFHPNSSPPKSIIFKLARLPEGTPETCDPESGIITFQVVPPTTTTTQQDVEMSVAETTTQDIIPETTAYSDPSIEGQ